MRGVVAIDFACNDPDNGLFAGKVCQAQFGDCELESPRGQDIAFTEVPRGIRIHRRVFADARRKEWFGNWCWNRYWLPRAEAKRLLLTLRSNGWRVTCGPVRLCRWWDRATP